MFWIVRDQLTNCTVLNSSTWCEPLFPEGWGCNITEHTKKRKFSFTTRYLHEGSIHKYESIHENLQPSYKYSCYSQVENEAGWSEESIQVSAVTKEAGIVFFLILIFLSLNKKTVFSKKINVFYNTIFTIQY